MEKASAQLHRQKEATVTYFQQHGCTVSESLQTETLWPCVATMLEWLENLDNDVHYLYPWHHGLVETWAFYNLMHEDILLLLYQFLGLFIWFV